MYVIELCFFCSESAGDRLKLNRIFYDERWSKHRTNTSLDWSKQVWTAVFKKRDMQNTHLMSYKNLI